MSVPSVGVVVITHKAVHQLPKNLPPLLASPLKPRVLVMNSSSNDGTVELAREMGVEALVIPRNQFNHGATRELARKTLGTDIAVMITPDAIATDETMVGKLVAPLLADDGVAMAYARQIPHDGADYFESFPRHFNYPAQSEVRSRDDISRLGTFTFFCSDSCAAWSNRALDAIGGFQATLTMEDTIAAAKLLYTGYRVVYNADAVVKHSHRYSLAQEFKRYFDTGYIRGAHRELFFRDGSGDAARGSSFLRAMLADLAAKKPWLLPYALTATAFKFAGYKMGYHARRLPPAFAARLSNQDYYWSSVYAGK